MWKAHSTETVALCETQAVAFAGEILEAFVEWFIQQRASNKLVSICTKPINKVWDLPDGSFSFASHEDASELENLRELAAKRKDSYWAFKIWYMGEMDTLPLFMAACPQGEGAKMCVALLEAQRGKAIDDNPEFQVVRAAEPEIEEFDNPFTHRVGRIILDSLKQRGLLS